MVASAEQRGRCSNVLTLHVREKANVRASDTLEVLLPSFPARAALSVFWTRVNILAQCGEDACENTTPLQT